MVSARCASRWNRRVVLGFCGVHPLRPPAALLHKAAFCEVVASRYAKAALGVDHRWRALTGLQNRPYAKWPALGWLACLALCIAQALRAVFWSVACGQ